MRISNAARAAGIAAGIHNASGERPRRTARRGLHLRHRRLRPDAPGGDRRGPPECRPRSRQRVTTHTHPALRQVIQRTQVHDFHSIFHHRHRRRSMSGPGAHFAYLPAPTVQSHAANLMTLADGRLGCVWFGGTQEGVADICIYFSAPGDRGQRASGPHRSNSPSTPPGPSRTRSSSRDAGGTLWLLYTAQHAGNQDTSEVRRRISSDADAPGPRPRPSSRPTHRRRVRPPAPIVVCGRILVPVFRCITVPGEKWVGDADDSAP